MRMHKTLSLVVLVSLAFLASCSGDNPLIGSDGNEKKALAGTRVNALPPEKLPPAEVGDGAVRLPAPVRLGVWSQPGGSLTHSLQHVQIAALPKPYWATNIGSGTGKRNALLAEPVIADGQVFSMDPSGKVIALRESNGEVLWQTPLAPEAVKGEALLGGGVTYGKGRVFASTGFAEIIALEAATGKVLWRRSVTGPVRAGATLAGDTLYFTTVDNKGWAVSASDGSVIWSTSGNESATTLLAAASPAVSDDLVLLPYSSGQISAVRASDGSVLWSDVIAGVRRNESTATISDIAGHPVIDNGRAYVIGYGGLLVAIDTRTGNRVWELPVSSTSQPWLAGDTLFILTTDANVMAISAATGKVRWSTKLPLLSAISGDEANGGWAASLTYYLLASGDIKHVRWLGPVLMSDRLLVVGSDGRMLTLSPYDGSLLSLFTLPFGVTVHPTVANGQIYVQMDNGDLVAFK